MIKNKIIATDTLFQKIKLENKNQHNGAKKKSEN